MKGEKKKEKPLSRIRDEDKKNKLIMWISVSVFFLVIFFLWGWAMKIRLSNLDWSETKEANIIKNSQKNWDELFTETEKKENYEKAKGEIREFLKQIMETENATTTAATTTTSTASTTSSEKATSSSSTDY